MSSTGGPQSGEVTLSSLLHAHPRAPIAAVREDGIFTDMPDSVEVGDHPVMKAASALDLVTPPDRGPMISAWDRARATGMGRCGIRFVSNPETPMTFYAFDARDRHGVFVVAFVPAEEGDRDLPGPDHRNLTPATPKVATTRKDERATFLSVDAATTQIL